MRTMDENEKMDFKQRMLWWCMEKTYIIPMFAILFLLEMMFLMPVPILPRPIMVVFLAGFAVVELMNMLLLWHGSPYLMTLPMWGLVIILLFSKPLSVKYIAAYGACILLGRVVELMLVKRQHKLGIALDQVEEPRNEWEAYVRHSYGRKPRCQKRIVLSLILDAVIFAVYILVF